MRVLVIGAGAIGGYFGARLLAARRDVTFLVRPARAEALAKGGLVVRSGAGDVTIPHPPTTTADALVGPFDLIIVSCKSYDLELAIQSFAPVVGKNTVVLPLLNGIRHIDVLNARFGRDRVFGGHCAISATMSFDGVIHHLVHLHTLGFGAQPGALSTRREEILQTLSGASFVADASDNIMQDMWEKWVMIATIAGSTCLMRAPIGDILAAGASDVVLSLLEDCCDIAAGSGFEPRAAYLERLRAILMTPNSLLMSSMLRDIESGSSTECEHILGDLLIRARSGGSATFLKVAHAHAKSYEARRARESASR